MNEEMDKYRFFLKRKVIELLRYESSGLLFWTFYFKIINVVWRCRKEQSERKEIYLFDGFDIFEVNKNERK